MAPKATTGVLVTAEAVVGMSVKACTVCTIAKPLNAFYRWTSTKNGLMSRCKVCSKKATSKTLRSLPWAKRLVQDAHRRTKRGASDLTEAILLQRYADQGGLCAWFGVSLTLDIGSGITQVSLDRLDNERGYVADNVALVCRAANLARNSASMEEFEIFVGVLRSSLNRRK